LKAIILAAGEGKRLRPLTQNIPKCMVKLFGTSLLQRQIDTFKKCKINDIIVVTGYCDSVIKTLDVKQFKNKNYDSTNMLETLFCVENELTGSVIISYGDIIFEKKVLQSLIDSNDDCSVIIDKKWEDLWFARMINPMEDVESLKIDANGCIIDIGQKVKSLSEIEGQYIGLMKFQKKGLKFLLNFYKEIKDQAKKTGKNPLNPDLPFEKSYLTDFIRGLINADCKMKAIPVNNGWLELDALKDFELYNQMYENGTLSKFIKLES